MGQSQWARACGDLCINCVILLVVVLLFAVALVLEDLCRSIIDRPYIGQVYLLLFDVLVFIFTWLLFRYEPAQALQGHPGAETPCMDHAISGAVSSEIEIDPPAES